MDIDAFVTVHQGEWDRLGALADRRRLTAAEADELLRLYERASTHLSMLRAVEPDGPAAAGLSTRLGRARSRLTGVGENVFTSLACFFTQSLPAAFYRIRWLTVILAVAFCAIGIGYGMWAAHHPQLDMLMPPEAREHLAGEQFVSYYSEHPNSSFASQVWTNNTWIAAQLVAFGVSGAWVPFILFLNAQNLGLSAGIMAEQGELGTFWLYILPHGLMELTAVFVAGAAGLRIFWAWVSPGQRPRLTSLSHEGRRLITVALGLALALLVSGVVEGFVTPSDLPHWLKITIGALVLAGYWTYTLTLGRRAHRAGASGGLSRYDAGHRQLTA